MTLRPRLALTVILTALPLVAGLVWVRQDLERQAVEDGLREFVLARMAGGDRERCEASPETFGGRLGPRERPGRPARGGPARGGRGPRGGDRPPPDPGGFPPPRGEPPPRPGERPHRAPGPGRRGSPEHRRPPPPPPGAPGRPSHFELWAYGADYQSANPAAPPLPGALRSALDDGDAQSGSAFDEPGEGGYQLALRSGNADSPCAVVLVRRFGPVGRGIAGDLLWGAALLCAVILLAVLVAAGPIVRRIRQLTGDVRRSAAERYAKPVEVRGKDEIAGLARAFNDAGGQLRTHVERLEEREQTLRNFVANTTHDVMLPLTVLQGHLSAIQKHVERAEPIEGGLVRDSLEEAQYMGSLVHNLSAAAKLEAGEGSIQRHPVDLGAVVERAVARHRTMAQARGIDLNHAIPEEPAVVAGDLTLIEQAISNVIHNAVRYNDDGGHVAVLLTLREGTFDLRVVDDGPGMPPS